MERPERVPQEERTRAMRQRVMDATIECLVDLGWSGTTTTEVSRRAGVSRGAQLHHFPTKQDLVLAAVEYLSDRRAEEASVDLDGLTGAKRTRAILEGVSQQYVGPVFFAALDLWTAARTDADLRAAVAPLERRLGREAHRRLVAALDIDEKAGNNRALVQATLDLMRGLALASTLSDDSARRAGLLDAWADVLDRELERP
ncbi:TetR/AcrR family transcriptional regulator [Janibacter sp. HTCC2649]|uniref:TetR/AcrR family transcriptional regulator n=1 Tax=Janibacter sp. HTCC2649 TaxID=313589 RepID=UPI000325DBEE|nr:TetR family transcriptional regulator [Janibacter sp. HTCC2649]